DGEGPVVGPDLEHVPAECLAAHQHVVMQVYGGLGRPRRAGGVQPEGDVVLGRLGRSELRALRTDELVVRQLAGRGPPGDHELLLPLHAQAPQRVAEPVRSRGHVAVGETAALVDHREPCGPAFGDVAVDEPGGSVVVARDLHRGDVSPGRGAVKLALCQRPSYLALWYDDLAIARPHPAATPRLPG